MSPRFWLHPEPQSFAGALSLRFLLYVRSNAVRNFTRA